MLSELRINLYISFIIIIIKTRESVPKPEIYKDKSHVQPNMGMRLIFHVFLNYYLTKKSRILNFLIVIS